MTATVDNGKCIIIRVHNQYQPDTKYNHNLNTNPKTHCTQ